MSRGNWYNAIQRKTQAAEWIKKMEKYQNEVEETLKYSHIYEDNIDTNINTELCNKDGKLFIDDISSVDAIFKYKSPNKAIGVLNFASYKEPGGKFLEGAMAQEEALCHESNLYDILVKYRNDFYIPNHNRLNRGMYRNNIICLSDVVFDREDKGQSAMYCDVITCAAPNKRVAKEYCNVPDNIIYEAMEERIDHLLYAAFDYDIDTLILGAFGCGVFTNDPRDVATIFKNALNTKYKNAFHEVIFAIPKGGMNNNYEAFKKIFND